MRYDDVLNFALQRHQVYERKAAGLPRGEWTDNLVLSRYKFTNVYRELDRNTVWIRENVRERFWGSDETIPAVFVLDLAHFLCKIPSPTPELRACYLFRTAAHPSNSHPAHNPAPQVYTTNGLPRCVSRIAVRSHRTP